MPLVYCSTAGTEPGSVPSFSTSVRGAEPRSSPAVWKVTRRSQAPYRRDADARSRREPRRERRVDDGDRRFRVVEDRLDLGGREVRTRGDDDPSRRSAP